MNTKGRPNEFTSCTNCKRQDKCYVLWARKTAGCARGEKIDPKR